MTDQQKRATTGLSLLVVSCATFFIVVLAAEIACNAVRGDRFPGRLFMLAIANWGGLANLLKSLPAILSAGLTWLGRYKIKDWLFYATIAVSIAGAVGSIYIYLEVSAVDTAQHFWAYSPVDSLQDYQSFVSGAHLSIGAILAWYIVVIITQLGIKTSK